MKTNSRYLALSVLLCSSAALAATGQSKSELPKHWYQDLRLTTFGWTYGPALGQMNTGRTATPEGQPGSPMVITQQLNLNAPATADGNFRYTFINFVNWSPVARADGAPLASLSNPFIGIAGTHFENKKYSWWGRYEVSPALTEASRKDGQYFTVRAVKVVSYSFGKKNQWKLAPAIVPALTLKEGGTTNSIFLQPVLTYTLNDRVSWSAFSESFFERPQGESLLTWKSGMRPTLAIGPTYTFKNGYWVQPFLNLYTGTAPSADTAHFGAYFGGRIL
jgi:hypothetical protein